MARLPRDGDRDGRIFDGTKREMPAPVVPRLPSLPKDATPKAAPKPEPVLKADKAKDNPFEGMFVEKPEQVARREAAEAERLRVQQRWDELYPDGDYVAPGGVDTSGYETLTPEQSKLRKAQFQPLTGEVAYLSYEEEGFDWGTVVGEVPLKELTKIGKAVFEGMSPEGREELAKVWGRTAELAAEGKWDDNVAAVFMPGWMGTSTELYLSPPDHMLEQVRFWEGLARDASQPGYVDTGLGAKAGKLDPETADRVQSLVSRLRRKDELTPDEETLLQTLTDVKDGKADMPDWAVYTLGADYMRAEAQRYVDEQRARFTPGSVRDGWAYNLDDVYARVGSVVMERAISSWAGDGNRFGLVALEKGVADEFGVPYVDDPLLSDKVKADTDLLYDASPEAWRTAARTIYDRTQAALEAQGITEALVYRGVGNSRTGPFDSPLTSWSLSPNVAQQFAGEKQYQVRVPADRIFGAPMTGLGKSEEAELVLLPSDVPVAEVDRGAKGLPRMFDTWLDYDEDIDDALSLKPVLKSNAMTEQVDAPTTEPMFRKKGGDWKTSAYEVLDSVDGATEDNMEVLPPGSRPGDAPVPYADYPFKDEDVTGARLAWRYEGVSESMATAAAEMTGVADMPGSGWWSDNEDHPQTEADAKALLAEVAAQDVTTMPLWSGQSGNGAMRAAEAGDTVAVPLMSVSPSRDAAMSYATSRYGAKWVQDKSGELMLQWERSDAKDRADLESSLADPKMLPLLLGANNTLRTAPAGDEDRNVLVQFDSSKTLPAGRAFEGITSGQYRVKSVQDVPDPDGLAYWDAEAGEFRHTPARLVTVEFTDDLTVEPLDRRTMEREVLLKSNAMAGSGLSPEAEAFIARADRDARTERVNRPVSDDWRDTYRSRWKHVPDRVRNWALRTGGLQALDYNAGFYGDDAAQVVAGSQLYVDLIDTETTTDFPLWRGDPYIRGRQVGDKFVEIRGFSADRDTARQFSRGGWVYRIEPGDARVVALDLSGDGSRLTGEKEVVVGGTFEVTAVDADNKVVSLKQVAPLPESELARRLRRSGDTIVEDLEQPEVLTAPEPVLTSNAMNEAPTADEVRVMAHVMDVRDRMDAYFSGRRQRSYSAAPPYDWAGRKVASVADTVAAARDVHASAAQNLSVQVPSSALPSIVADGRLKSQFESGVSRGTYDPSFRRDREADLLGVPGDLPVQERPIYGFVENGGSATNMSNYGEFTLRLSPSVADRTSLTFGDSFVVNGRSLPLSADPSEDDVLAAFNQYAIIPPEYVETQIQGGVTLDDVTEVVLKSDPTWGQTFLNDKLLEYAKSPLPNKPLVLGDGVVVDEDTGVQQSTLQALAEAGVTVLDANRNPVGPVLKSNAVKTTDAREVGWGEAIDAPSEYWGTDYTLSVPEKPKKADLEDAVKEWVVNDPEEVRAPFQSIMVKSGIGPWADEQARTSRRRLAALLNALETRGKPSEGTLFRGITIYNEWDADIESIAMDLPSVGRTVDLPPSGFTTRRDVADRFAEVDYYQYGAGHVSVIYHLAPGAQALELNRIYNPGYSEGEMLVGGRFTVTDRKIDKNKGIIHLYLTQDESIGLPTDGPVGEWR